MARETYAELAIRYTAVREERDQMRFERDAARKEMNAIDKNYDQIRREMDVLQAQHNVEIGELRMAKMVLARAGLIEDVGKLAVESGAKIMNSFNVERGY